MTSQMPFLHSTTKLPSYVCLFVASVACFVHANAVGDDTAFISMATNEPITAPTQPKAKSSRTETRLIDLSLIEASPHELALTQVLSEICPSLINVSQHKKLSVSYHAHLKLLMPKLDPMLVMPQLNQNSSYLNILKNVREWTLSYPDQENRALCIEFSEATIH